MAARKLTVVLSQAQGKNPVKRQLEESIAAALIMEPGIDVSIIPNLYDMPSDHSGMIHLRNIRGDVLVFSWLFPRASRWILDRQGVRGHEGFSPLNDPDEEPIEPFHPSDEAVGSSGLHEGPPPDRKIWCVDLREEPDAEVFIDEAKRIAASLAVEVIPLALGFPTATNGGVAKDGPSNGTPADGAPINGTPVALEAGVLHKVEDPTPRRWYPVIDYSRCTNCMECIDFCLFGVYGVDMADQILVESQDSCKKGCPACSRVCPENAIIFPQHKTPAIAGSDGEIAGVKIDLSKLFGGVEVDPLKAAVAERDAELVADGREAVGASVGLPKRQAVTAGPRDDLDDLMDGLDALDL